MLLMCLCVCICNYFPTKRQKTVSEKTPTFSFRVPQRLVCLKYNNCILGRSVGYVHKAMFSRFDSICLVP